MLFPKVDRVIYQRNPLVEVLGQLSFHDRLEIGDGVPSHFQRNIRQVYPYYQVQGEPGTERVHQFVSDDEYWRASLGTHFIGLSTTKYEQWEEFVARLEFLRETAQELYQIEAYTHVSLRYIDVIQRSALGLDNRPWAELLTDQIGLITDERINSRIAWHRQETRLALDDNTMMWLRVAAGAADQTDEDEQVALIDLEFFDSNPTEASNARTRLDSLHEYSGRAFRGCITNTLHEALGPISPEDA